MTPEDSDSTAGEPEQPAAPDNLFARLPASAGEEESFDTLVETPGVRIERIVSHGHRSPEGFWYDQEQEEWVLLVAGAAGVEIAGEGRVRELAPGDHLLLPAHCRHRVAWTAVEGPTIWLAVHYPQAGSQREAGDET